MVVNESLIDRVLNCCKKEGFCAKGPLIVLVAGIGDGFRRN